MKKSYYIGVLLLVLLGLGMGFILHPGYYELGLMNMQEKKFKQALDIYEKRYAEGDHSLAVAMPLSKLYLQYGRIRKSIQVMEAFVQENPDNLTAWQHLATLYQNAEERDHYITALEHIIHITPSAAPLRELADAYHFKGEYTKQVAVLSSLIDKHEATPADYMLLIYLHVSQHDFNNAVVAIHALPNETLKTFPADAAEFLCNVLIDAGKRDEAITLAKNYINMTAKPGSLDDDTITLLSSVFLDKGDADGALALLSPLTRYMHVYPQLLIAFAEAEKKHGNTDKSFALMLQQFRQKKLPPEAQDSFLELALLRKQYALFPEIIASLDNPTLTASYVQALLVAARVDNAAYHTLLDCLQHNRIKQLSAAEKRDIAFMLLEHNNKALAEPLFFELARNAPAHSPDVAQLLYLFGPEPPEYGQQWLISRAKHASGNEQAAWLKHMGDAGMDEAVVALAENLNQQPSDTYIEALIAAKQFDKAKTLLAQELDKTQDIARIKKLTNYAMQVDARELALSGYSKRYKADKNDYQALRELARVTYEEGSYSESKTYLEHYLAHDAKDYLMQYYYAEIFNREKDYSNAKVHYAKTIELIVATPAKDTKMNTTYALALYRLGDTGQSFEAFRRLIAAAPHDTAIRESFANILIEGGRYREAEEVLSNEHIT